MKLEEIESLWSQDCRVDKTNLDQESLHISELHNKYYKIFIREKMTLKQQECDLDFYKQLKREYYNGTLSQEELKENGWLPFPKWY